MAAIGSRVPMIDATDRVTGRTAFVLNDAVPGMLAGAILRSPYPHARVSSVDVSRAEHLAGVVAVLSRDHFPASGVNPYFGPYVKDMPLVAIDRVRYAGEPVIAVAAVDEDTAREALDLIEVEYEQLPAVFEPRAALAPDAPLLHERGNILNHVPIRMGDVESGFAMADYILEDEYTSPPVHHVPLEPHVAIAEVVNGRITVRTSTQTPNAVQTQIASMFGVPLSSVRVIVQTLGGGYGAKCYPRIEPLTVALSWKARQPVRVELARDEVFHTLTKHAAIVRLKTSVKRDGTLVACAGTCYYNTGAYADVGATVAYAGSVLTGPYRVPHVSTDVYAVYTNLVPAGAFRGYGVPQTAWAYDTQMDRIAAHLGIDPLELRLKNALEPGDTFGDDISAPELHCRHLLEDAAGAVEWSKPRPLTSLRGSIARGRRYSPGDERHRHALHLERECEAERRRQPRCAHQQCRDGPGSQNRPGSDRRRWSRCGLRARLGLVPGHSLHALRPVDLVESNNVCHGHRRLARGNGGETPGSRASGRSAGDV